MVASFSDGALQTIAQGPPGRRWILLEAPFDGLTEEFHEAADELRTRGFGVLMAHPERVAGIAADGDRALGRELEHGTLLQVNSWSLAGAHGEQVRAGDLRFIARLRGLRGLVHLPNQRLARYGLLLHEPYVVTVHDLIRYLDLLDGGGLIAAPGRRDAWCLRRDYVGVRRAAAVIAVSEATRRSVVRHLGVPRERVFVVHNGLDHERFRPPRSRSTPATHTCCLSAQSTRARTSPACSER